MGIAASLVTGKGPEKLVEFITGTLYDSFIEKDPSNFEKFHEAFLEMFTTINSTLPGRHYDVPSYSEVKDKLTLVTGLVMPPASMAAKKVGERVPTLNRIKVVPDVLFVPTTTVLALLSVKFSKFVFDKRLLRQNQQKKPEQNQPTTSERKEASQ